MNFDPLLDLAAFASGIGFLFIIALLLGISSKAKKTNVLLRSIHDRLVEIGSDVARVDPRLYRIETNQVENKSCDR
jgi:hypothetical protein